MTAVSTQGKFTPKKVLRCVTDRAQIRSLWRIRPLSQTWPTQTAHNKGRLRWISWVKANSVTVNWSKQDVTKSFTRNAVVFTDLYASQKELNKPALYGSKNNEMEWLGQVGSTPASYWELMSRNLVLPTDSLYWEFTPPFTSLASHYSLPYQYYTAWPTDGVVKWTRNSRCLFVTTARRVRECLRVCAVLSRRVALSQATDGGALRVYVSLLNFRPFVW
jgi:hypothetical protein